MKPPIFVRTLSKEERKVLEAGLRSSDAFVLRRCQILLAQLKRRAFSPDSRKPTLRPTNCAQRHPRLQRKRPRFPKAGLFASQRGPRRIRRAECPRLAGDAPPGSEEVRQRRHLVDTGVRRTSQLREGSNQEVGKRTDHPSHPGAPWGALAESETLDRKSGSRIRRKKGIEIG